MDVFSRKMSCVDANNLMNCNIYFNEPRRCLFDTAIFMS